MTGTRASWPLWAAGILGAWLLAVISIFKSGDGLWAGRLGDTDDAMRLVQVREYLAGRGWFDLHIARLQPPEGYDSHWSRFIDAGLAGLYRLSKPFLGHDGAELFMRALWPLLWLLPVIAAVALLAMRIGGAAAGWIALAFSTSALIAFQQFQPGRIDHSGPQIALALLALACLAYADLSRRAALAAGFISGAMCAIGLETLPFLAFILAAAGLIYVFVPRAAESIAAFWLAFAAGIAFAFVTSLPPDRWTQVYCDQIAVNLALPLVLSALIFTGGVIWLGTPAGRGKRLLLAGLAGIIAITLYALMNPACLKGPFGMVDPAIKFIWLDHVTETEGLLGELAGPRWPNALAIFLNPTLGLLAAAALVVSAREKTPTLLIFAALALSIALLFAMVRLAGYAAWLAIPPAAAAAAQLWRRLAQASAGLRIAAVAALSPVVSLLLAVGLLPLISGTRPEETSPLVKSPCFANTAFARLAALPRGRVLSGIDFGPMILALTPHEVLAAPYHRLSTGIIDTFTFFTDAAQSEAVLRRTGVNYVVMCRSGGSPDTAGPMLDRLRAGDPPPYLEEVAESRGDPMMIYKVR